jgi:ADP-sugar diphosphatase
MLWRDEPKVQAWLESLERAGCTVHSIEPDKLYHKRNGELLFGVFRTDVHDSEGNRIPPIAVVRGNAVIVVPLIRNQSSGEERYLMVLQRRIGNGRLNLEFPAGMLDRDTHDPEGVAVRELHEETGLSVDRSDLFPLHHAALNTSVGLLDEAVYFYGCRLHVDDERFRAFDGARSDELSEHEHITTILKTARQIEQEAASTQTILGLRLMEQYHGTERA